MELLERYLYTVSRHLPPARRDDIIAELRENLLAAMEDRESQTGRSLSADELAAMLQKHGRPLMVAMRYLPQRSLIGPALFPFFLRVLGWALPLGTLIYVIASASRLLFGAPSPLDFGALLGGFFSMILHILAWVTLTFAAGEFVYANGRHLQLKEPAWDPRDLPSAEWDARAANPLHAAADLVINALLVLYLLVIPYHPVLILGPYVNYLSQHSIRLVESWRAFYWLLVGLQILQVVFKTVILIRPRLSRLADLSSNLTGVIVLVMLTSRHVYFVGDAGAQSPDMGLTTTMNSGLHIAFVVALIVSTIVLAKKLYECSRSGVDLSNGKGQASFTGSRT